MHFLTKFCLLVLGGFLLIGVSGCDQPSVEPIEIGYVGGLTGRTANLGIAGRDGVILAVEQLNHAGGINGRKVKLVIKDDKQDDTTGANVVQELVDAKVPVIIGPMTSSMGMVMAPIVNRSETLLLSPTVSTMMLGNKDDNFLRVYPQCMNVSSSLAEHVTASGTPQRFVVLYDLGNRAFTESWMDCFGKRLVSLGGEVVDAVSFISGEHHSLLDLVRKALLKEPTGLLILANSLDTALLVQQVRKMGSKVPVYTSEWSMTRDLLMAGGHSVEGVTLYHTFNEASEKKEYLAFKNKFEARFKRAPSFPAIHAYDAAQIIFDGLRHGALTGPALKTYILQKKSFMTLQSSLNFDQYGDVVRDMFLTVVKDGKFVVVEQLPAKRE